MADSFLKINGTDFLLINVAGDKLIISADVAVIASVRDVVAAQLEKAVNAVQHDKTVNAIQLNKSVNAISRDSS